MSHRVSAPLAVALAAALLLVLLPAPRRAEA